VIAGLPAQMFTASDLVAFTLKFRVPSWAEGATGIHNSWRQVSTMQTYAWDAKAAQRGDENPQKSHDHGPDAFRYFAHTEVPYWRLAWGGG